MVPVFIEHGTVKAYHNSESPLLRVEMPMFVQVQQRTASIQAPFDPDNELNLTS